jgi:membrane-bound lytic murein transglycosylase A
LSRDPREPAGSPLWAAVLLCAFVAACAAPEPPPDRLALEPAAFDALEAWDADGHATALAAFLRSCAKPGRGFGARGLVDAGYDVPADAWANACTAAAGVPPDDDAVARTFFEDTFVVFAASNAGEAEGLFTGYYEPLLHGALEPRGPYRVPLHRRPDDLVSVSLGAFDPELNGRRIAGRVEDDRLVPYADREAISAGALQGRDLELLWVDDPIDHFFLQIQGSGRVALDDGSEIRVGYDGQNGHAYRAIGRDLIEMQELTREEVSLQSIRAWLRANPDQREALMNRNASYVFFRELGDARATPGPPGAQGVPLTPGRSLAVDRRYLPLGIPIWLETTAPWPDGDRPLRRLMIAQDTGGAIRGPVRGDVFWGHGADAEHTAGHMKSRGRYFLLLPKAAFPAS